MATRFSSATSADHCIENNGFRFKIKFKISSKKRLSCTTYKTQWGNDCSSRFTECCKMASTARKQFIWWLQKNSTCLLGYWCSAFRIRCWYDTELHLKAMKMLTATRNFGEGHEGPAWNSSDLFTAFPKKVYLRSPCGIRSMREAGWLDTNLGRKKAQNKSPDTAQEAFADLTSTAFWPRSYILEW